VPNRVFGFARLVLVSWALSVLSSPSPGQLFVLNLHDPDILRTPLSPPPAFGMTSEGFGPPPPPPSLSLPYWVNVCFSSAARPCFLFTTSWTSPCLASRERAPPEAGFPDRVFLVFPPPSFFSPL